MFFKLIKSKSYYSRDVLELRIFRKKMLYSVLKKSKDMVIYIGTMIGTNDGPYIGSILRSDFVHVDNYMLSF